MTCNQAHKEILCFTRCSRKPRRWEAKDLLSSFPPRFTFARHGGTYTIICICSVRYILIWQGDAEATKSSLPLWGKGLSARKTVQWTA